MDEKYIIKKIDCVDSTNKTLEEFVYVDEEKKDVLLIAKEQTNGKGRFDRKFFCPRDKGIYISLLHYYENILDIEDITLKVGFNIFKVLKEKYNKNTKIKLINDIYYNDKKVIGILCKNIISKNAIIIGIGIDIYKNDNVPEDLKNIVGYLFDDEIDVDLLIKNIIDGVYNIFNKKFI